MCNYLSTVCEYTDINIVFSSGVSFVVFFKTTLLSIQMFLTLPSNIQADNYNHILYLFMLIAILHNYSLQK